MSGAATLEVAVSSGLADVAREAFVHAMSRASIVTALGAGFAWRYLPARAAEQPDEAIVSADADNVLATVNS